MLYAVSPGAFGFGDVGDVGEGGDVDVEDEESWEPDFRKNMLPWQIENAIIASRRRTEILKWLSAAGAKEKNSVKDSSLPMTPKWQGGFMR